MLIALVIVSTVLGTLVVTHNKLEIVPSHQSTIEQQQAPTK